MSECSPCGYCDALTVSVVFMSSGKLSSFSLGGSPTPHSCKPQTILYALSPETSFVLSLHKDGHRAEITQSVQRMQTGVVVRFPIRIVIIIFSIILLHIGRF
jgi:hypothetical protein